MEKKNEKKRNGLKKNNLKIKKKGPGRPRKNPKKEPIPRKGISDNPLDKGNLMEILYDSPIYLKKVIIFFKSLAASHIQIVFKKDCMIFYAYDHYKKSKIQVKINGNKLNHYYCEKELDIGINCKDLELILNKVDKEYNSIIMIISKNSYQKNIIFILENEIQIDEIHTIDVIGQYIHMTDEKEFDNDNYMIEFTLPGRYFRKTINDIKSLSSQLSIQQEDNTHPLEFGYNSQNKKIRSKHILKNTNKLNLISKLKNNNSFRIDIKIDYIKPISSSLLSEKIKILVDENRKFTTHSEIDNGTIILKTLTEIIDNRPKES